MNEIPPSYRVAALSNMSAPHWNRIKTVGWPDRFEAAYVSCEIGHLKPSREAFELALREMALPAANVLFLDDRDVNVQATRAMGINAHVVMNPAEARALLERHGVLPKNAQAPGRGGQGLTSPMRHSMSAAPAVANRASSVTRSAPSEPASHR